MRKLFVAATTACSFAGALSGCGGHDDGEPAPVAPPAQTVGFQSLIKVANVGPAPGFDFDLGLVDSTTETYYLADRTNKSIDIVDAKTNTVLAQVGGYVGQKSSNSVSGPNGMELVGNILYTGDGDSTIKIIDLSTRTIIKTLATGGTKRVDAFAYDAADNVLIVTNKNETVPFASFVDPRTNAIIGTLPIPSTQLDAVIFDPTTKKFLISVTSTAANPGGEVDVVDPKTRTITAVYPVPQCLPGGLAIGPSEHLLVGCSGDAIAAGFLARSIVLDASNGLILKSIPEVGGSDEVTYNSGDQKFYTASRDMTSNGLSSGTPTPVLGVIDAVTLNFIKNVPTSTNSKSVAADPKNNHVFVPLTNTPGPGIGVYGPVPVQ